MDIFFLEKRKFSSLVLFYSMGKFKCFLYFCVFFSVLSYSMGKFKCFLYSRVFFSLIVVLDFLLFLLILLLFFEKISIFLICFFSIGSVSLDLIQNRFFPFIPFLSSFKEILLVFNVFSSWLYHLNWFEMGPFFFEKISMFSIFLQLYYIWFFFFLFHWFLSILEKFQYF